MKLHKILYASVISLAACVGVTSCDNDFDYPPVVSPDLGGNGSWDAPLSVAGAYAYYTAYYSDAPDTDKYYWITGYIIGCVNTTETVFVCNDNTAAFSAPFESTSNMLLAPTPDCTDYTECISVQLPSGDVRNALNLNANPSNLGKEVSIRGYIDKYLGIPGVRSVTHYQWGPTGIDTGDVEVGKSDYTLLTGDITSGRAYALVAEGSAAQTVSAGDNGFLYTEEVTIANNKFTASEKYGFMLTAVEEGSDKYYITDYKGQFLYQSTYGTGWSNRPSISTQPVKDDKGYYWTLAKNETGWVITNVASNRILAYDTSYKSYGLYEGLTAQYLAPELYEMANDPAIQPDFNPAEPGNPGDVSEGTGEGTLESPYDVTRALAIVEAGSMSSNDVYIKGKISEISEIDTGSYGNATYYISDDGTTAQQLQVYRGYYLDGARFTSSDAIKVGDEVVILGKLTKYNTTAEVAQGSKIVSLNGSSTGGGTDTPTTPSEGEGDGSYESPFNPADVIALNPTSKTESPAGGAGVWVKGFIVGHMPLTNTLLENTVFDVSSDVKTNIVLGPTADCKDYTQCISIQLPSGTVRDALNLMQNPNMLGAEVLLYGDVMNYCSGPGLKNTSKYEIVGEGGGNTGGDTPAGDGNGSYESPFNPADVIALNPTSKTESPAGGAGVWVKGFIVGHMPLTNTLLENTVFDVSSDVKTNIVLGPTADCKDYTQCISIQLPSGTVRDALNLMQNPDMLGAEVLLYGDVMNYCSGPGLKNTSKYEIVGEGGGNTGTNSWEIKNFIVTGK